MPKLNFNNPICQHVFEHVIDGQIVKAICGHPTIYNGTQKSGAKQYRCRRHVPDWTCTDSDRPAYRKGEKLATAMSAKERFKKWYAKHKKAKK